MTMTPMVLLPLKRWRKLASSSVLYINTAEARRNWVRGPVSDGKNHVGGPLNGVPCTRKYLLVLSASVHDKLRWFVIYFADRRCSILSCWLLFVGRFPLLRPSSSRAFFADPRDYETNGNLCRCWQARCHALACSTTTQETPCASPTRSHSVRASLPHIHTQRSFSPYPTCV